MKKATSFKITIILVLMTLLGFSQSIYTRERPVPVTKTKPPAAKQTQAVEVKSDDEEDEDEFAIHELETLNAEAETTLGNLLRTAQHRDELEKLQQEKDKLALENELLLEKNRRALAQLNAEKERVLLENELETAKQIQMMAKLTAEKDRLDLENAINEGKKLLLTLETNNELAKLNAMNLLQEEKNKQYDLQIQSELSKIQFEMAKMEFEKAKKSLKAEELSEKIAVREQEQIWDSQVNTPKEYLEEPYVDGHLILSDRRINLDGPIIKGVANYVTERIHYFNNKSANYPIFLVIDRCPGGSVSEGSKIVKAMQNSRAPVYVVVKTFAASMAASITALAKRSYAYPDAIFVHHQVLGIAFGNVTQQKEQLKIMQEWAKRIDQPIADKMGISMEQFVDLMYKNNSDGNWIEFADSAVKLKWVDTIIEDIRDTSYTKQPVEKEEVEPMLFSLAHEEKVDPQGHRYVKLPPLSPLDVYYLYNPDNYYR